MEVEEKTGDGGEYCSGGGRDSWGEGQEVEGVGGIGDIMRRKEGLVGRGH